LFQLFELISKFLVLSDDICARVKAFYGGCMFVVFCMGGVCEDACLGHITAHNWVEMEVMAVDIDNAVVDMLTINICLSAFGRR
jgi:hypothetical protein